MKNKLFLACFLMISFGLHAQSNEFMDSVLESKAITVGQAAYLVLAASEKIPETSDVNTAFSTVIDLKYISANTAVDKEISYAEYSYMLLKAFNINGGFMYAIFPSQRYAYKELKSLGMFAQRVSPTNKIDGYTALQILNRVSNLKGL